MGLRTAAAKLGFRLAAAAAAASNKNITCSRLLFSRRSSSSLATATTTTTALTVEKKKVLYLYFKHKSDLLIRPIKLDGYDGDHDGEMELHDSDIHTFPVSNISKNAIQLGSQILFWIGQNASKDICWVDLSMNPLKIQVSSPTKTKIKSFSTPKSKMSWGVIDGNIYCFNSSDDYYKPRSSFEFFDPETENSKWELLSSPPFIWDSALYFNRSKRILGWEFEKSGVLSFDTTKPENGWATLPPSLGDYIPFIGNTRLVIEEHHPTFGNFNLVFAYDRFDEPFLIHPFLVSENCDSFQAIDQLIRLPKDLCSKYRVSYSDAVSNSKCRARGIYFDSEFVHVGDRKFCLVLHKFVEQDLDDLKKTKTFLLVLTYEYNLIVNDKITEDSKQPDIKIKTRLLGIRQFKSCLRKRSPHQLTGAFVF